MLAVGEYLAHCAFTSSEPFRTVTTVWLAVRIHQTVRPLLHTALVLLERLLSERNIGYGCCQSAILDTVAVRARYGCCQSAILERLLSERNIGRVV